FNLKDATKKLIINGARVVIIDDAIDTGRTMQLASEYLLKINPEVSLKKASLTITHRSVLVRPDYFLYERTILQFPWSLDA
ncbi:MAG: phosphoribosyltransferase family protein, partial [Fulvivirga sp.]|uniref:phosphoribosyltransferase family protein n=1 Tax=Fulvivirga sp. TaxID=1931237 RepID=UPI0032ECC96A